LHILKNGVYAIVSEAIGAWAGARDAYITYGIDLMISDFSEAAKESFDVSDDRLARLRDQYPLSSFGEKFSFNMMYCVNNYLYDAVFYRMNDVH